MPELYCFVYTSYTSNPIHTAGSQVIRSKEGFQQSYPLSSGLWDAIDPILTSLNSDLRIGFMDDFLLSGEVSVVADDVERLVRPQKRLLYFSMLLNARLLQIILTTSAT